MRAVDTNIVVRYLTNDDAEQSPKACRVVEAGNLLVTSTVLIETAWVLSGRQYRFAATAIAEALRHLIGLPGVRVTDASSVSTALDWATGGMDFADAFHLAGARDCTAFVSFDRVFAETAARLSALAVIEP